MRDYYESLWTALPATFASPEPVQRRRLLAAELTVQARLLGLGCGIGKFTAIAAAAGAQALRVDVAAAA